MAIVSQEAAAMLPSVIEEHTASSLIIDERVQRHIRPGHLKHITSKLDLDAIGVITVSRRDDGTLVIIDGQHRVRALVDAGMGDWPVTCRVFEGLTVAQEAGLFRRYNTTSKTNAIEDLLKAIVEGEPEAVAINAIAERNKLRISLNGGPGYIACATAMRKVYGAKEYGPAALGFAIHVGVSAWGANSDSVDSIIVRGLGEFYLRYGEEIDRAPLIRKLGKHTGGPRGLIGKAKTLADLQHTSVHRALTATVLGLYNAQRSNKLPPL